ncbi:MAG: Coq4 family protein [Bdellovibrionia bacterium]
MGTIKKCYHILNLFCLSIAYAIWPENVKLTFKFADHLIGLGAYREIERVLTSDPETRELIRKRHAIQAIHLSELGRLPKTTLGRQFADHMIDNELDPNFYPPVKIVSDRHYVLQRIRSMHDILHIVTGFDTSENGEVSLQSFLTAQIASPFSMMVVGGFIFFFPFKTRQDSFAARMDGIVEGWRMGRLAKPVFNYDWNKAWSKPLDQVRAELGIQPRPATIATGHHVNAPMDV